MGEYKKVFVAANKFSIPPRAAANMRIRYLTDQVHDLMQSRPIHPISAYWINEALDEILWLHMEASRREQPKSRFVRKDRITDADIDVAKEYPVTNLVKFVRGKAEAWCHEDNNPSLYYADRINRAVCPVCDKKFNAIDVLMYRDGMTFKDAVKELR